MTLVQFSDVDREYGAEQILEDISLSIQHDDKIGLIGVNGCGKTTLIKLILSKYEGKDHLEKGNISLHKGVKIGYLSQDMSMNFENTILEEMREIFKDIENLKIEMVELEKLVAQGSEEALSRMGEITSLLEFTGGFNYDFKIEQVLFGLGVSRAEMQKQIKVLSGGEKNRVALAKLLLENPDLLILDEPTNHLDINGIEWLEEYLVSFKKAVLIVSHDRYFLDRVVNKIFEIENRKLEVYNGNFSKFVELKKEKILAQERAYDKQQKEIKATEAYILKYKAGIKSKQARGRSKQLARLERIEKVYSQETVSQFNFSIRKVPTDRIFQATGIDLKVSNRYLARSMEFSIYAGDRIGIIGKNGTGKSTLLKTFEHPMPTNQFAIGSNLEIGYYDQNHGNLDFNATVFDELRYNFPLSEEQIRSILARFLFEDSDLQKKISVLSGGERAKLSLIKLSLQKPNVLVLDEPTNHLDIYSKEILIDALENYEGTLIVVSHDRYFLQSLVEKMLVIQDEQLQTFDGDFDTYKISQKKGPEEKKESQALNYQEAKTLKNRMVNLEKRLITSEEQVLKLEEEQEILRGEFDEAGRKNEVSRLLELQESLDKKENEIEEAMAVWESLESELTKAKELLTV